MASGNSTGGPTHVNLSPGQAAQQQRLVVQDASISEVSGSDSGSAACLPAVGPMTVRTPSTVGKIPKTGFWNKFGSPTITTTVAVIAAAIALVSAAVSIFQEELAKQQNSITQHQQLESLVANLARSSAITQQAKIKYKDDQEAFRDVDHSITITSFGEAEEAASIIQSLHGQGVTPIEYYIVAKALENGNDYTISLRFLDSAAANPMDLRDHIDALRESATLLYRLGGPANIDAAETKIAETIAAINGALLITDRQRKSELVYTYLFDAERQANINCGKARGRFRVAQKIAANITNVSDREKSYLARVRDLILPCLHPL